MRTRITFLCNEQERCFAPAATVTVLEWLRAEGLRGTKEGCAEGDCGACTVVLGEPHETGMRYRPVNACILFMPALDGRQLLTIEHLADAQHGPHPVQRAMVARHGSQCGFCTPGFVMSLFALHHEDAPASRATACEALAGNLCRCTGYRPIIDAALDTLGPPADHFAVRAGATGGRLRALPATSLELTEGGVRYTAPRTLTEAVRLRAERPEALLLAGGTDIGVWVTKQRRALPDILALDRVGELGRIEVDDDALRIGAAACYEDALPALAADWPELGGMMRRLGSRQIRHRGTIGGNLGTASPIGDMAPALIALDAIVVALSVRGMKMLPVDQFLIGYRKTALAADELVARIDIPRPTNRDIFRVYKVSKRPEEDISSVCAAFCLRLENGRVASLRAGFGGLAATPLRATALENAVAGQLWNEATLARGIEALNAAIAPIDDARASARYRRLVAGNLLRRLFLETSRKPVRARLKALAA